MKYEKLIERIQSETMSRHDLEVLTRNAVEKQRAGDIHAGMVIDAIQNAKPKDSYILFMGFCPGADFARRLDTDWKKSGKCRFDYLESKHQRERFESICKGDLVILKKREKFGETMKLYGHGRVLSVAYDNNEIRYLNMEWSKQDKIIEVPLMGCNSTVDIKSVEDVENVMPANFYKWLEEK